MTPETEVLLRYCEESAREMRHIEGQRAGVANVVFVTTAAIVGLALRRGAGIEGFMVGGVVILLGFYGILTSAKLYERHQFCQARVNQLRAKIDQLNPGAALLQELSVADDRHARAYRWLVRFRLHYVWAALHALVILLGVLIAVASRGADLG